jgi:hypothetical protein
MNMIFISYADSAATRVEKMADYLVANGFICWYRDHDCPIGSQSTVRKLENLRNSFAFISIISDDALDSQTVKDENKSAIEYSVPVIHVNVNDSHESIFQAITELIKSDKGTNAAESGVEHGSALTRKPVDSGSDIKETTAGSVFSGRRFLIALSIITLIIISFFLLKGTLVRDIIKLDQIPAMDSIGGDFRIDTISGSVRSCYRKNNFIVIYSYTNTWYIQPFDTSPLTAIRNDGTWETTTHLGSQYLIMLVKSDYQVPPSLISFPPIDEGIITFVTIPRKN